jgi:hypothetical protein
MNFIPQPATVLGLISLVQLKFYLILGVIRVAGERGGGILASPSAPR